MYCYRSYYILKYKFTKFMLVNISNVYLCVHKADLYALTSIDLGFSSDCYIRCTKNFRCAENFRCPKNFRCTMDVC